MRLSRVKRRWAEGKPVLATVAHFTDPSSAELIGLMGIDCLWIDLEHQPMTLSEAATIMRAARVADMDVMARPAKGEFMRTARLLEAGATLIMYPRCESAEEARELVRCTKFPPLGERGFFSASPDNPYCMTNMGDYLRQANEETILIAQIESPAAVEQSKQIASVDGIDLLFFGPGDFTLAAGIPGNFQSPLVRDAIAETCRNAIAAGKRFGTLVGSVEQAKDEVALGASLVCYGGDLHFVREALANIKREFGAIGFDFDNKVETAKTRYAV